MDWLLNLIPGGGITAAITGIVAALGALFALFKTVQRTGYDKRKAEEAEADAKVNKKLVDAVGAKPARSVSDDPNNRDNWPGRA